MADKLNNDFFLKECIQKGFSNHTPYLLFINFPYIKYITGVTSEQYFNDAKTMMDSQVETYQKIGTSGPIFADFGTVAEASAFGAKVVFDHTGIPSISPDKETEIEDFAKIKKPDPFNAGILTKQLEFLEYFVANAPRDINVTSSNMMAPLSVGASMRGISEFCLDIYDDIDSVLNMLETITQTEIENLNEQNKILSGKMTRVLLSDDISSFLNPEQFKKIVAPIYKKIYTSFPEAEHWLHNDGESAHLAAEIAKTGVQLWHIGKCVNMEQIFEKTDNKVALCGNLDPLKDLINGSKTHVYEKACSEIQKFKSMGKHICGAGGFIGFGTDIENVKAIIKAVSAQ